MPNVKSIFFKMAVLQGGGQICPHVCVIQWNRVNNDSTVIGLIMIALSLNLLRCIRDSKFKC